MDPVSLKKGQWKVEIKHAGEVNKLGPSDFRSGPVFTKHFILPPSVLLSGNKSLAKSS